MYVFFAFWVYKNAFFYDTDYNFDLFGEEREETRLRPSSIEPNVKRVREAFG